MLKSRGKLVDMINLAEESLSDLIEDIRNNKANVRIQGLIISSGRSYEVYVDFKEGSPVLALLRNDAHLEGDAAWNELNEILREAVGFIEVYELTVDEIDSDLDIVPTAKIKLLGEKKIPINIHNKIEEYSVRLAAIIPIKTLFIVNSVHLDVRAQMAINMTNLSSVIANEIEASTNSTRYIIATISESEIWRSLEILIRNREVLAAVIYKADGSTITGIEALKIMLNPRALTGYGSFEILIYEVEIDPIKVLEEAKIKIPILRLEEELKGKIITKAPITEEKVEEKIKRKEIEEKIDKIIAKANEYFLEVLDVLGYELEDLNVDASDDIIRFKVKIRKKGFSFRRPNVKAVKKKLIDEARWILAELRLRIPFEVEVKT